MSSPLLFPFGIPNGFHNWIQSMCALDLWSTFDFYRHEHLPPILTRAGCRVFDLVFNSTQCKQVIVCGGEGTPSTWINLYELYLRNASLESEMK